MQHQANPVILNSPLTSQTFKTTSWPLRSSVLHCGRSFWIEDPSLIGHRALWKCSSHAVTRPIINVEYVLVAFSWFCLRTIIIPRICIICNTATLHTWKNGSNPFVATLHVPRNETCLIPKFGSVRIDNSHLSAVRPSHSILFDLTRSKARRYRGCCKSSNHSLISSSTFLTPHYHGPAVLGAIISSHQPEASSF